MVQTMTVLSLKRPKIPHQVNGKKLCNINKQRERIT